MDLQWKHHEALITTMKHMSHQAVRVQMEPTKLAILCVVHGTLGLWRTSAYERVLFLAPNMVVQDVETSIINHFGDGTWYLFPYCHFWQFQNGHFVGPSNPTEWCFAFNQWSSWCKISTGETGKDNTIAVKESTTKYDAGRIKVNTDTLRHRRKTRGKLLMDSLLCRLRFWHQTDTSAQGKRHTHAFDS